MCNVRYAVCSVQYTVCSVHYPLCSLPCALHNVQCATCSVQCAIDSGQCALHCVLHTSHCTLRNAHYTPYIASIRALIECPLSHVALSLSACWAVWPAHCAISERAKQLRERAIVLNHGSSLPAGGLLSQYIVTVHYYCTTSLYSVHCHCKMSLYTNPVHSPCIFSLYTVHYTPAAYTVTVLC